MILTLRLTDIRGEKKEIFRNFTEKIRKETSSIFNISKLQNCSYRLQSRYNVVIEKQRERPVAGVAVHLVVVLRDRAGVKQLPTCRAAEAELVVDVSQAFDFLGKIHILVASRTNSGHDEALLSSARV